MPTQEEIVEAYEAKIKEYEEILEQTLSEPKSFGVIQAGPFEEKGQIFYRASKGRNEKEEVMVFLNKEPLFGIKPFDTKLEKGTEVLLLGQTIIAEVPEELKIELEAPTFDLISWDEIGGIKSQVKQIREAIELPMNNAKLAEELGVTNISGALLYGAPGCGKTLMAKAIASTIVGKKTVDAAAFQYVKGGEMLSMFVGKTEQDIKDMFNSAREYSKKTGNKALIFIDEAEALLPRRGSRKSSDVETTIVPTFLSEMSGFDTKNNPIVILATNLKEQLDDAVIREGRIDIQVEIKRPTLDDAKDIFAIHLKKLKTHDTVEDLSELAAESLFCTPAAKNVSGAMIETISQSAIRNSMVRIMANPKTKERGITLADISESIQSININYAAKQA